MGGRNLGVATSQSCAAAICLPYSASTVTQAIYVSPWGGVVSSIQGRVRVAGSDGSAVNLKFYKAPSGTAAASGTLLHSGSYDCKGTADANQTLTLVTDLSSLTLAPGDSLNVVLTGTPTSMVGVVQIMVEPLN